MGEQGVGDAGGRGPTIVSSIATLDVVRRRTVKTHVINVFHKLWLRDRVHAAYARRLSPGGPMSLITLKGHR